MESYENELLMLEIIHRYVETLDKFFGSVCELDLIFNFEKAYQILDEMVIAGFMQEVNKKSVLRYVEAMDQLEANEEDPLNPILKEFLS